MKKVFLLSSLMILVFACKEKETLKNNNNYTLECDQFIELNSQAYNNATTNSFNIDSMILNGNCLEVIVSASGCDGSTWSLNLIDAEVVLESYPIQRQAKLVLNNQELCLAYFTKTFTFDLQPLQYNGDDRVVINIDNWQEGILYQY